MVLACEVKQRTCPMDQPADFRPRVIHSLPAQPFAKAGHTGISHHMDGDRTARALARIEAASARIEAATAARPKADPDLQTRYEALRKEACEAPAQLDLLIGELER